MRLPKREHRYLELALASTLCAVACAAAVPNGSAAARSIPAGPAPAQEEASCPAAPITVAQARPLVDRYCVSCHSPGGAAGEDYDFRSDNAIGARRRNIEAKLRLHLMPPPDSAQPNDVERAALRCWAQG